jgi:putative transposase
MPLSVRIYECPQCGLVMDRDHNGSVNILAAGLKAVGRDSRVNPEAPGLELSKGNNNSVVIVLDEKE